MDIRETVTRRYGPLPAWGWGVAAIGGIALVVFGRGMFGARSGGDESYAYGTPLPQGRLDSDSGGGSGGSNDGQFNWSAFAGAINNAVRSGVSEALAPLQAQSFQQTEDLKAAISSAQLKAASDYWSNVPGAALASGAAYIPGVGTTYTGPVAHVPGAKVGQSSAHTKPQWEYDIGEVNTYGGVKVSDTKTVYDPNNFQGFGNPFDR